MMMNIIFFIIILQLSEGDVGLKVQPIMQFSKKGERCGVNMTMLCLKEKGLCCHPHASTRTSVFWHLSSDLLILDRLWSLKAYGGHMEGMMRLFPCFNLQFLWERPIKCLRTSVESLWYGWSRCLWCLNYRRGLFIYMIQTSLQLLLRLLWHTFRSLSHL
jgi:hypothetical protein